MPIRFDDVALAAGAAELAAATSLAFTEGPAVHADGTVFFSDIENNRIMRLAPDGTRSVFRQPCGTRKLG